MRNCMSSTANHTSAPCCCIKCKLGGYDCTVQPRSVLCIWCLSMSVCVWLMFRFVFIVSTLSDILQPSLCGAPVMDLHVCVCVCVCVCAQRWTVVKYFYFTQVNLKTLPVFFFGKLLLLYIPKHIALFNALHFINK